MLIVFICVWVTLATGGIAHHICVYKREIQPLMIAFIIVCPPLYWALIYAFRNGFGGWV